MLVAADRCVILAGSSRSEIAIRSCLTIADSFHHLTAKIVQSLIDEGKKKSMPVQVITRGKDPTANEKLWDDVFSTLDGVSFSQSLI